MSAPLDHFLSLSNMIGGESNEAGAPNEGGAPNDGGAPNIDGVPNIEEAPNTDGTSNIAGASNNAPICGKGGSPFSFSSTSSTNLPKSNRPLPNNDAPAGTFVLKKLSLLFLPPILNFGVSVR